jgi:hypothetical protein
MQFTTSPHPERALSKRISFLNYEYQAMVRASLLVVISSVDVDSLNSSPSGEDVYG